MIEYNTYFIPVLAGAGSTQLSLKRSGAGCYETPLAMLHLAPAIITKKEHIHVC